MAIGTTAALVGASVVGSAISANAAGDATDAQVAAANRQAAVEERIYDETTARFQPFYDSGLNYQNALDFELLGGARPTFDGMAPAVEAFTQFSDGTTGPAGAAADPGPTGPGFWTGRGDNAQFIRLGGGGGNARTGTEMFRVGDRTFGSREEAEAFARANPTGGAEYRGFEATPWQNYLMEQTLDAVENSAAASGSLFSGATAKGLQDRASVLSNSFYGEYLNRLAGQAAQGQAAAGNMATAGANFASGMGQVNSNIGNAQAAGAIGQANAWNSGIGQTVGILNYQNMLAPQAAPTSLAPATSLRPMMRPA